MIHASSNGSEGPRLIAALGAVVEAAVAVSDARGGYLRVIDAEGCPRLLVHRGLPPPWVARLDQRLRTGIVSGLRGTPTTSILVEEVDQFAATSGTSARQLDPEFGLRSLQTTLIREESGRLLGMLSTLHDRPPIQDAKTLRVLDALAGVASPLLTHSDFARRGDTSGEFSRGADRAGFSGGRPSGIPAETSGEVCRPVFFDEAPVALAAFDRDMRYLAASRRWRETFELEDSELSGRSHYEVFPDTSADCVAMHQRALSGFPSRCEAYRLVAPDGRVRWLRWEIVPWRTAAGEVGGILICLEDITARKTAEDALRASEDRLHRAHEAANMGAWEWDVRANRHHWGDETIRLMGVTPGGEMPSLRAWVASVHPDDRVTSLARAKDAFRRHAPLDLEWRVPLQGGPVRWLWARGQPEFGATGQLERYTGVVMDITERKRFEAESSRHDEVIQALTRQQVAMETAAAFAHELSQPLASVVAYSEFVMRGIDDGRVAPDRIMRAIRSSHDQAARAGRVLQELIDNLHRNDLEVTTLDLGELVRDVIDAMRKSASRGFEAALDIQAGLPPVLADRLRTERVLRSLVRNGLDAMEESGLATQSVFITVHSLSERGMADIEVRDTGPGIDARTALRVFDPFFSTKPQGLGLGLAIARTLVEAQGGRLWLDPVTGSGAAFHFTLPLAHE